MMPKTKKINCVVCNTVFDSFHLSRYCSPSCKQEGYVTLRRTCESLKKRTYASTMLQKLEWKPQPYLSEDQEKQALQIAQYCTKSALRYCKMLLIEL